MNQHVYNNEVTSYPNYPIKSLAINWVQLPSRKELQGPTIIDIDDSPNDTVEPDNREKEPKELLFPIRFKDQP